MYSACVYHNATKTIYVLGGLKKVGSQNIWLRSIHKFSIANKNSWKKLRDIPCSLMGISAVIPDLNESPAIIYVAGLTDQNKVKVLRYDDHWNEWDIVAEFDH
jgi:N-acetylneuraminic acid mutarotase